MRTFAALPIALIYLANPAQASHDESIGARFVQPGGSDAGDCLDHHAPCVSIRYALTQAAPGNTVKVGVGIFDLAGIDPETFLHGPVHAAGGYDELDDYTESRPLQVRSIVTGVDARYRHTLAVRGFYWAESAAAARRGVVWFDGPALQTVSAAAAPCTQGSAGAFACRNLDFQAQLPLAQLSTVPVSAANIWGFRDRNDNREYAVLGVRNGTVIVEVTDPVNPREVVTIQGNQSPWREVKVYQVFDSGANRWRAYAYVTTEAANSGLQTIDLSGLPLTAGLASTNLDTSSQHTLYVSNIDYATNTALPGLQPVLYVAGSNLSGGSWRAYSLANPAAPTLLATAPSTRYMHDSTSLVVTGARAAQCAPAHDPCEVLVDFLHVEEVELWDVTSKLAPVLLGTATNPNNRYIHSGWPSADGLHLVFHDELEEIQFGLATQIYTLSLANLRAPTVQVSHVGSTTTTDHNGYMRGTYYYVSHYRRGVVVYDAADPTQLVEVAHFDNYVTPSTNIAGTDGTWGIYPFLPSGNLLASDIENGLFVLRDHVQTLNQNVGRVGFRVLAANGVESAGNIRVPVQRVGGLAGNVSVQYAVTAGSATDGADYTATSGTLSWGVGNNGDKDIVIALQDDTAVEGAETLTVTLSAPTNGATLDGVSLLTVTINDNDTNPPPAPPPSGGGGGSTDLVLLALLASVLVAARARRSRRTA
jgi:choice-of-anchor B domain-containing protein